MEPDDLLCSRNARPQKALVGRAQWKISQPHPLRENKQAWREHTYRPMRVVKDSLATSLEGKVGKNRKDRVGLLCSRNAHARKVLVGRAQWEANSPPSREEKASKLG